jgi:hypothetical protein
MIQVRRFFGPASGIVCVCLIYAFFTQLYGTTLEPPAIVNPRFKYWTVDPTWKFRKPLGWEVSLLIGPGDEAFPLQDDVDGRFCLGMHVYQDGGDDSHLWATLHVRQNLNRRATQKLLEGTLGVWVYPTFLHERYPWSGHPKNVFGIEINDGTNVLWIVFSQQRNEIYQISGHQIVIIDTPLNRWSYREVQIGKYYASVGWKLPSEVALIFLVGATKGAGGLTIRGWYAGFVQEVKVT